MNICECMYRQDDFGQSVCNRCRGDIYGCECPMIHSPRCEQFDPEVDKVTIPDDDDLWDEVWYNTHYRGKTAEEVILGHEPEPCDFCQLGLRSTECTILCKRCQDQGIGQHGNVRVECPIHGEMTVSGTVGTFGEHCFVCDSPVKKIWVGR